jgi:hypothetical protein
MQVKVTRVAKRTLFCEGDAGAHIYFDSAAMDINQRLISLLVRRYGL